MAAGTAELVRGAFAAYNSRDVEALLAVLHPEVQVHSLMTEAERADDFGHAGAREWYAAVLQAGGAPA